MGIKHSTPKHTDGGINIPAIGEEEMPCVLAVDDMPMMLRAVQSALRGRYKVYLLSQPEDIKNILQTVHPDLFLLDYNMPSISGFDLVPIIREFPEHKDTPVIFVTADSTSTSMTKAIALGACDFIVKPINPAQLIEKVDKHIRKS